ncbi:hypothetical protein BDB01DRAFT_839922 [Pilobolus umbonatus]|nr:hypothetical protein BDB01DRAFT_839922 [Pilobolus umbonatus]
MRKTVIFVQSSAHWNLIQGHKEPDGPKEKENPQRHVAKEEPVRPVLKRLGNRKKQRLINNHFLKHPSAVLYAEDMQPPGYTSHHLPLELLEQDIMSTVTQENATYRFLSRNRRYQLKTSHVSQSMIVKYESMLMRFIDTWIQDMHDLSHVCLQVEGANEFDRYWIHVMSRYYQLDSFS